MPVPKRRYQMRLRATSAESTRQRILEAAFHHFLEASYDEVSLEKIAGGAQVALKTVLRKFHSKDALLLACAQEYARHEDELRAVQPGDLAAIVRVLSARYEQSMDMTLRYVAVEQRVPAVAQILALARKGHWDWLAEAFAPHLPERSHPLYRRRVAELFAATEIYAWHAWRRHLGLGRKVAEEAMRETLQAIVARWAKGGTDE